MMKRYLLYSCLALAALPAVGQDMADYYRLPDRSRQLDRLTMRYGGPQIRDRWYVSFDAFVRTDRAKLDNSLNGLIESDRVTKLDWSAVVGWSARERWAIEAGYARMPIHTQVSVSNGRSPLVYRYTNSHNAFMLRGKRLLASTSGPWLRSGFWLSGGMWLVPNNGQREGQFSLIGYRRNETVDTLRLNSQTNVNGRATAMAELGAEYNVRLSNNVDLGFTVRKFWGLGTSLTTDVAYTINNTLAQQAQLRGTGSGMSYGVSLRYTLSLRRKQPDVLEVQGRQRIR
ncbi:hypothetical protein [Spirosoma montaniterrae]|uniref:Outer membrane protein beta-barrel domain-containing protein n=1 Tax=Spirosoma montaniterrae TaxID=1178516 RepID=A0A1P9WYJ8_9BACT|nr:hypothetical protein [Spirosoma montaniterrae]AQG80457.1 hypothetical protein AWR27_14670 [Spirosoma montaniterrae]